MTARRRDVTADRSRSPGVRLPGSKTRTYNRRRGMRFDELSLAADMRAMGFTYVQIAQAFRDRYGCSALVAMRKAHGWSQQMAAERWNELYPDDLKENKNFSYWEQWRRAYGYKPSLGVLLRLARLYQCKVSDLLDDVGDYRHLDDVKWTGDDYLGAELPMFDYCDHGCVVIGTVLSPVSGTRSYVNARACLHAALSYCKARIAEAMRAMETNELTSVRYLWGSQVLEEMKSMIKVLQDPSQREP